MAMNSVNILWGVNITALAILLWQLTVYEMFSVLQAAILVTILGGVSSI